MTSSPTDVVKKLLDNTTNPDIVRNLVAPDATYVSLNYENGDLKKVLPYAGAHPKGRLPRSTSLHPSFH